MYRYAQARGGLKIGRFLGGVVRTAAGFLPGPAGAIAQAAISRVAGGGTTMPGGAQLAKQGPQRPRPGVRGAVQRILPGGESGFITSRRMNPGNAKAARRAVRRLKSTMNMLKSIEKLLPRRKARTISPGVITRGEAARALRS